MPNRVIKDTIRTSKSVNALSDFEFRFWTYLITYVDDYGRGSADPELLKGFVFPRRKSVTEQQISRVLDDLATVGMITLYEVDGESFLCFPNWDKHQRIQTKRSKFPAPEQSTVTHREKECESNPIRIQSKSEFNPEDICEDKPRRQLRFVPPTVEEVAEYAREKGYTAVDPEAFINFYAAKGWMMGKNKMQSWRHAVAGWNSRGKERGQTTSPRMGQRKDSGRWDNLKGIDLD